MHYLQKSEKVLLVILVEQAIRLQELCLFLQTTKKKNSCIDLEPRCQTLDTRKLILKLLARIPHRSRPRQGSNASPTGMPFASNSLLHGRK